MILIFKSSPRISSSAIVFFLPFYATIFATLSITHKPCRVHPGRAPRLARVWVSEATTGFFLSFLLSPGHKATRGSLQAAIIIEGRRKKKKQTFRHPRRTVRPQPEPAPVRFLIFFPPSLPGAISYRSANR